MSASDVREFAAELRPILDRQLDDAEILAAMRDAATAKGIDWSQLKALVKAQAQDAKDDKGRVAKLVERAEFACAYADMLGERQDERESGNRSSSDDEQVSEGKVGGASLASMFAPADPSDDGLDIPPYLRREVRA